MRKNKNAFTLVELLAVIAILALIGLIAVPKVLDTINNSRNKGYLEIEKRLEEAASKYILNEYIDSDVSSITITKEQLISKGYIEEVYDLKDNSVCDASVYVSNLDTSADFYVNINCDSYISEDKKIIVTIYSNNGESTSGEYRTGEIIELQTPTKGIFLFLGWEVVKGDSVLEDGNKLIVGENNTIVYALWKNNPSFTIKLNGGTDNIEYKGRYSVGETIDLEVPTRENYMFVGWKEVEGNGLLSGNKYTMGTVDAVIEALWQAFVLVDEPIYDGILTYNGNLQSPIWNNYDESYMTISGDISKTNAGTYSTTFTLSYGYAWKDGTVTPKTFEWNIEKAAGSILLSASSGTITTIGGTKTFTVNSAGDGEITVSSSNTSVATATISGTTVTVKAVANGTATITVSVAVGTNHAAPSDVTYEITVDTAIYLYKLGDKCSSVTGGWAASGWPYVKTTGGNGGTLTPTITWNDDYFDYNGTGDHSAYTRGGRLFTVNDIDLTKVNKIRFHVLSSTVAKGDGKNTYLYIGVFERSAASISVGQIATKSISSVSQEAWYDIDVSSLSGAYAIGIAASSQSQNVVKIEVDRIAMELT